MSIESLMQAVLHASPQKRQELEAVLSGTTPKPQTAKRDARLITISGAAKLLALSRNSIYSLIAQRRISTVEITGTRRITMESINAFLDGERPANAATAAMVEASKARYAKSKSRKVA